MEAKYVYRICLLLTAVTALSVVTPTNNGSSLVSSNQAQYPMKGLFANIKKSLNDEISKSFHVSRPNHHQNNVLEDEMYKKASKDLPTDIVYGLINNEDIWNVKVGPFTDSNYVKELSHYLLASKHKITVKSDKSELGTEYNIFINSSPNSDKANALIDDLERKYHIIGKLTKNYS